MGGFLESVTAHCDLETGNIYGCEEGSKKWWHEKGHFVFNNDPFYSSLILFRGYIKDIWLFLLMVSIMFPKIFLISVLSWVAYFSIFLYEEWWCNQYANRQFKIFFEKEY